MISTVIGETTVIGEITHRTKLWLTVKILTPFIGWENSIGIPNQALGTPRHFWGDEGDKLVRKYAEKLLIESYKNIIILDKNIEIFVRQHDIFQEELKALDKLEEPEIKEKIKWSLHRGFYSNHYNTYGLGLSIYNEKQFTQILLAYKKDKRKIYLNQ